MSEWPWSGKAVDCPVHSAVLYSTVQYRTAIRVQDVLYCTAANLCEAGRAFQRRCLSARVIPRCVQSPLIKKKRVSSCWGPSMAGPWLTHAHVRPREVGKTKTVPTQPWKGWDRMGWVWVSSQGQQAGWPAKVTSIEGRRRQRKVGTPAWHRSESSWSDGHTIPHTPQLR